MRTKASSCLAAIQLAKNDYHGAGVLEHWYLFPVGIAVGSAAMSSGVSGSNFWIPVYLIWLELEPRVAFWISLATMLFGFGSGLARNVRAATIDWAVVTRLGAVAAPAAALAATVAVRLPERAVLLAFAAFVEILAVVLFVQFLRQRGGASERRADGFPWLAAIGAGSLQGAIATGSGVLLLPSLVGMRRIEHHATAVGSTVALVFACSLVAVVFRVDATLWAVLETRWREMASMAALAGSGALVGGQLGPRLAQRISRRYLRLYLAVILVAVGGLVTTRVLG